ncbi:I78 family peptidase inhibitor [Chenggangzhangella methanolivorans]|uniref:Peptidase inhibitor I78 family protein n=1 Tax=Chenggangzhangella methanolivorans TaxID=1437009 RepID=A0A9E6UMQ4_9HYPH|nr:I78 family peptidase inhibitor [Chenggangzhangella methanolivorans]QZO01967.1 hypothetical protein K6K41_12030 [Chenggangzhangella methanolivorans]
MSVFAIAIRSGLAATSLLAGCLFAAALAQAAPKAGGCEDAKALTLIGKDAPSDADARSLTGARMIRRVAPGDAATLDFRPDRLTIEIDKVVVVSTRCG